MAENDIIQGARRIEAEAVRRLYHGLEKVVLFMPLLPLALVAGLWEHVEPRLLLVWLMLAASVPVARHLLVRHYRRRAPDEAQALRWGSRITVSAFVDGVVWGAAGILFYMPHALPQQLLLLTMIVGIPAGSIFTTSWWPATLHAYAGPAIGMTAVGLAANGTPGHLALAAGFAVYLVILYWIMLHAHAAAMETIALRFENLDLVERLRCEKRAAEDANRAKSRFLAAASHDLRQPLHALGLFVETLSQRIRYPDARGLMDNIERSVAALESLFDSLLDISRLDAGIVEAKPRTAALRPLIERLESEFAPQARARGLAWRCAPCTALAVTDAALLERVLRNLLSNAVRYTERGEARLSCVVQGTQVAIEVADTGPGIPPERQEDVFREFFQLHNPERDRNKGLGLGLSIVRRLMELMDHPLEMHSAPGKGTCFRLYLPLGDAGAVERDAPLAAVVEDGAEHATVLVIDDEAAVREAMKSLLTSWGYAVVAVASGDEALRLLEHAPAAIIADYRLRDEETGDRAIRRVRAAWGAGIAALIVTGDTDPERLRQAQRSGFALLHKPVPPARLRAFLRSGIGQSD